MNFSTPTPRIPPALSPLTPPSPTSTPLLTTLLDSGASLPSISATLTAITTATALLTDPTSIHHLPTPLPPTLSHLIHEIAATATSATATPYEKTRYVAHLHCTAFALNADIRAETERYIDNMCILYAQAVRKMNREMRAEDGSFEKLARRLGREGLGSVEALKGFVEGRGRVGRVGERDAGRKRERDAGRKGGMYLCEIARFWRRWAGSGEARRYEDAWVFVAGRALVQE